MTFPTNQDLDPVRLRTVFGIFPSGVVAVAAQVAAQVCGLKVGPVAVLGRAVDRSGETTTVCEAPFGDVVFEQA